MNLLHFTTNTVRFTEICTVLLRNGFLEFLEQIEVPQKWFSRFVPARPEKLNLWQRIRVTAEELGPTFVKFAQLLSARPDVLPQPLIQELKRLRNQVKPVPWEEMRPALEHELEGTVEDVFAEFNTTPVAAGSVGQVYRARLRSGEAVAVKAQRPGIRKEIKADLEMIMWFARQMQARVPELAAYDLPTIVEEVGENVRRELDFSIEARNTMFFNTTNPYPKELFAPKVFEAFTTRRVLVLEWIDGVAPEQCDLPPEARKRLAEAGGRSVFHQIMLAGFFHGDPHTGNLFITPDQRLCLLDWGLAGRLTRQMRYFIADLFSAIDSQNPERVVQVALANAVTKRRVEETRLEKDVSFVLRKYSNVSSPGEAIGRVMIDLLYVFGSNGIQLARDYSLLAKAVIAIEDAAKTLDPSFDVRSVSNPFLRKLNMERWHPRTLAGIAYWELRAKLRQISELPGVVQRLLRNFEEGEASINFVHRGLDGLRSAFSDGVNRLVLAIIIASTLLSSSLIITRADPEGPFYLVAEAGYFAAVLFGLLLLFEAWRDSRRK